MERGIEGGCQERSEPRRLTKREIDRRIGAIGLELTRAFAGFEGERIEYLGREIYVLPMDTRRLIKIVGRHLSFN